MKQKEPTHKQQLGRHGENLAVSYLKSHGYRISGTVLVFIEVKTRIGRRFGIPEESVTPWKLRQVVQTAQYYKLINPELPQAMRIDVIGIEFNQDRTLKSFNHIDNVTL